MTWSKVCFLLAALLALLTALGPAVGFMAGAKAQPWYFFFVALGLFLEGWR